jgi:hypothetical protein
MVTVGRRGACRAHEHVREDGHGHGPRSRSRSRTSAASILAVAVLVACTGPGAGAPANPDAGSPPDAAGARPDAVAVDVRPDRLAPADSDPGSDPLAPTRLELLAPVFPPPVGRTPVVLRALRDDAPAFHASGAAALAAEGGGPVSVPRPLHVYRGAGSTGVVVAGRSATLIATFQGVAARHVFRAEPDARRSLPPGATLDEDTTFGPFEEVTILAGLRVRAGVTLTVREGTTVALGGNLRVEGRLEVVGTPAAPVWFRPVADTWGGVEVGPQGAAIAWALFSGGGADAARAFGHSASQPVLWVEGGTLTLDHVAIVDSPGKALGARDARVALTDGVIARCDTGGELESTHLSLRRTHVLEIPDADGVAADDDNDALYLLGPYPRTGAPEPSLVADAVFAVGEDDGLDQNGATVRVEGSFFEGFRHEGGACSGGGRVEIVDTLVRGCEQGVEAGYGAPEVVVRHSVVTGNGVGFRYGDAYDWEVAGTLAVVDSIAVDNAEQNVRNHVNALGGPRAGALRVETSLVDQPDWDGRDGNLPGRPLFDATFHLREGSPGRGAASDGTDIGLLR